jgi:xanthine dehydrogenase accessory factor
MISRPDFHDLIRHVATADPAQTGDLILATVWNTEGSTPLPEGAKALFDTAGLLAGTVGGGALERETLRTAPNVRHQGTPRLLAFDLQGPGGANSDPICGGQVHVLLQPLSPADQATYGAAAAALDRRQSGLLQTTLSRPSDGEVSAVTRWIAASELLGNPHDLQDRSTRGVETTAARACLAQDLPRRFAVPEAPEPAGRAARIEVLWEPVVPKPVLIIVGGGHVGQALAAQAHLVGFAIRVVDDRPDFLAPEAFPPGTRFLTGTWKETLGAFPFDQDTYVAIMTRGHLGDAEALAACLDRPAAYLGMIGSRRKVALLRETFLTTGRVTVDQWNRVHAPIGLDIGAVSAPEIAASIVAQLIATRRGAATARRAADASP